MFKLQSTTTLSTVLLLVLLALGNCDTSSNSKDSEKKDESHSLLKDKEDESSPLSRSIPFGDRRTSQYYNYGSRDIDRDMVSSSSSTNPNMNMNNNFESSSTLPEMSTVISSTSYSIKPGTGSSSNVYVNTKPTPIIITRNPSSSSSSNHHYNDDRHGSIFHTSSSPSSSYFGYGNSNVRRGSTHGNSWTNNYSPSSDCFNGRNCPKGDDDEYKSYYSVLNGNLKYPERLGGPGPGAALSPVPGQSGARRNNNSPFDTSMDSNGQPSNKFYERRAAFPFHVHGIGPDALDKDNKYRFYPNSEDDYPKRRVTRTSTTSSPSWVKLQPIKAQMNHKVYDPFFSRENERHVHVNAPSSENESNGDEKYENAQFANRIGIELSPESFAERWGYGGSSNNKGSRLPSWLEELNNNHPKHRRPYGSAHTGPTRDEDPQNWVKLDPIPVAGVSISKWVPKGTSPSDLPSTGNLIRDKPSAWWDRPDNSHAHVKRPSYSSGNNLGWASSLVSPSSPFHSRYPSHLHETKRPNVGSGGDAWADIIYPNTPSSATASWESSTLKGISGYPSSFGGSSSNSGWKSSDSTRRGPVASWSANSNSNNRFGLRRPTVHGSPSNYPDPQAHEDDPRWILVSNSRRVSLQSGHNNLIHSDRHKYRPQIGGYRDDLPEDLQVADSFLYESEGERDREPERDRDRLHHGHHQIDRDDTPYFNPHSHRLAKNYKMSSSPLMTLDKNTKPTSSSIYDEQEEAFSRINATLQTLTPFLNHKKGLENLKRSTPPITSTTTQSTTTSTTTVKPSTKKTKPPPPPRRQSFLSSLLGVGTGRGAPSPSASTSNTHVVNLDADLKNGTKIVISRKPNSLKPILAAVGAGMIPATIAAGFAMGRKKRDINEEKANHFNEMELTPVVFKNKLYFFPSEQDSSLTSAIIEQTNSSKKTPKALSWNQLLAEAEVANSEQSKDINYFSSRNNSPIQRIQRRLYPRSEQRDAVYQNKNIVISR